MNQRDDDPFVFEDKDWLQKFHEVYYSYQTIYNYIVHDWGVEGLEEVEGVPLEKTLELSSRQMIVLFCTYIEVLIKDFMFTFFSLKPELMCKYQYLPKEFKEDCLDIFNQKAISLNRKAVNSFANIATNKAFSFNIKQTINIERISEEYFSEKNDYKDHLINIFNCRNYLVHENRSSKIDLEKVIDFYYLTFAPRFIKELGGILR